eukprot:1157261-Pelagomonas_calceolata.AAC.5
MALWSRTHSLMCECTCTCTKERLGSGMRAPEDVQLFLPLLMCRRRIRAEFAYFDRQELDQGGDRVRCRTAVIIASCNCMRQAFAHIHPHLRPPPPSARAKRHKHTQM